MDRHNLKVFIIQAVLCVVIVGVGILGFKKMKSMKKPPERTPAKEVVPLVKAVKLQRENIQMVVQGYGTVKAKLQSSVVPEIAGKIISANLEKGGFFKAGEVLIEIDSRDYELAVKSAQAQVASAKVKLEQELAEAVVAKQEWEEINPGKKPDSPLVFREPQVSEAKAGILSAESNLAKAQLNLERTKISMPFDGRVVDESIDVGEFVQAGKVLAHVYGTDVVEIEVPLEDFELAWFDVGLQDGAAAKVMADFAGKARVWQGKAVRLAGDVDPDSRMVTVIVEVQNPFEQEKQDGVGLLPGIFVDIAIDGKALENAIAVPRSAVHNRGEVWLVKDGRLVIRKVAVARSDRDFSYVIEGIEDGDVVITSPMDAVVDGMKVRVEFQGQE